MLQQQQNYFDYYEYVAEKAEEAHDKEMEWQQKRLEFYKGILSMIENAYTGSLSYLNSIEKADYLDQLATEKLANGDDEGYLDTITSQLEYEKAISTTREEYAAHFNEYINELQTAEPEKDLDDVVETLEEILAQNKKLEEAIVRSSYQQNYKI